MALNIRCYLFSSSVTAFVPHSPPKLHQQRGMELRRFALVALLASASAFQLRPCAGRTAAARPALAQPPRILLAEEEGNELPSLPSPFAVSDSLIQFSTLSDDYKKVRAPHREAPPPRHSRLLQRVPCPPIPAQVVLAALEQSNKGRILSGMPVYPSVEGMVESYMQYGGGRDLSAAVTRALLRPLLSPSSVPPQGALGGSGRRGAPFCSGHATARPATAPIARVRRLPKSRSHRPRRPRCLRPSRFGLLALLIGGVAYALIFPSEVPPV